MDARTREAADETAALVALLRAGRRPPWLYAARIEEGETPELLLEEEQGLLAPRLLADAAVEIARWQESGIRVLTLLSADYPANLRAVYDRPPLLFASGQMPPADSRAIAVIGSRRASAVGLDRARAVTERLVDAGYAIASGLASGIDAAAHRTALERGGRTIAVIGTGLLHAYPRENRDLQRQIAAAGIVFSQFWPETGPVAHNFPKRNAVMSGLALATVVVEAAPTSGARTQVRAALAHGRPVLLSGALLEQQWAQDLAARPGVYAFHAASEMEAILDRVVTTDALVA